MYQEVIVSRCAICEVKCSRRCARCHLIYYCTIEHQRQDWKRHKSECIKVYSSHEKKERNIKSNVVEETVKDILKTIGSKGKIPSAPNSLHNTEKSFINSENYSYSTLNNTIESSENVENIVSSVVSTKQTNESIPSISDKSDSEESLKDITTKLREESVTSSIVHTDQNSTGAGAITYEGSSENEILSASTQQITSTDLSSASVGTSNVLKTLNQTVEATMPVMPGFTIEVPPKTNHGPKEYPEASIKGNPAPFCHNKNSFVIDNSDPYYELCQQVIRDMSVYGVCVLDNFLGRERGALVLKEVLEMYRSGIFQAGQLVSSPGSTEARTIRSDRITWIDGKETNCVYVGNLIQQVDNIILRANKMPNNGKMGDYIINGRTKAMVACYPGGGSRYVKHVDNPNKDGRCITAIYYLNLDWDVNRSGGLLRVFPEGHHQVADIAPLFDRMLFFWSDRRNPHEVQPAFDTRYAITLWYFDAQEREDATKRFREKYVRTPSTSK